MDFVPMKSDFLLRVGGIRLLKMEYAGLCLDLQRMMNSMSRRNSRDVNGTKGGLVPLQHLDNFFAKSKSRLSQI
jgi:hypothetical protein